MIFHAYSLIFFTVLAQTVVGGYLLVNARILALDYRVKDLGYYNLPMFILWTLMGLGFLFSIMHLGSPFRALNALNQVGSAWLSNEIFFGAAFFAVGGLQWLLCLLKKGNILLHRILMVAAMLLGIAFMFAMIKVYMIETVPTWYNIYTPLSFIMTIIVAGLLLSQLLIVIAQDSSFSIERNVVLLAIAAIGVSLIVTIGKMNLIDNTQSSITKASELIEGLNIYLISQVTLLLLGLAIWIFSLINKPKMKLVALTFALSLILGSELIGRGLFYSLHMTSGL